MNEFMRKIRTAAFAAVLTATAGQAQGASIDGEVKKIDEGAGKITLKHGPAKSLGMDQPTTMVYRMEDAAMLKQVKVGDKVQFEAENADAGYTVTKIHKSK